MKWKLMHSSKDKKYIGIGINHRIGTWPPDNFNGTLKQIHKDINGKEMEIVK